MQIFKEGETVLILKELKGEDNDFLVHIKDHAKQMALFTFIPKGIERKVIKTTESEKGVLVSIEFLGVEVSINSDHLMNTSMVAHF